jgi:hypothetical protein
MVDHFFVEIFVGDAAGAIAQRANWTRDRGD